MKTVQTTRAVLSKAENAPVHAENVDYPQHDGSNHLGAGRIGDVLPAVCQDALRLGEDRDAGGVRRHLAGRGEYFVHVAHIDYRLT